ncbi:MAG: hypothetical protein ACE5K9_05145 [Candidatus Methylomirabilales bacterium]
MKVSSLVAAEVRDRFSEKEALLVLSAFEAAELPFLEDESRTRERARVQLAVLKLANGSLSAFEQWLREACVDWRDVLVAAGMAHENWLRVLREAGFRVPEGPP